MKNVFLNNQKIKKSNILLLIYILMNTLKNYTTIHLRLNLIDVLKVAILLMTDLVQFVFQIKQDLNINVFINESNNLRKNMYM